MAVNELMTPESFNPTPETGLQQRQLLQIVIVKLGFNSGGDPFKALAGCQSAVFASSILKNIHPADFGGVAQCLQYGLNTAFCKRHS